MNLPCCCSGETSGVLNTVLKGILLTVLFFMPLSGVYAQQPSDNVEIAKTYVISGGEPISGDIVSFDKGTQQFQLSRVVSDENVFGVIVENPLLVLENNNGGVPVIRSGEAYVNVTAINGAIQAGDYITSSSIPGKGQKSDDTSGYVVGVALEPFIASVPSAGTDGSVAGGSIRVLLSVGTKERATEVLEHNTTPPSSNTGVMEATILNIVQYVLAAFIVVGSIYVAFKNFGPNIKNGIVSIGRNPLAKASIQSMIILNAVLIVLISVGGVVVGFAILLLPI